MNETKHRGKPRVEIWAYGNDGMCKKFNSITQASLELRENPATVKNAAKDERITRKGYLYSFNQLTVNEVLKKFEERDKKLANMKKNQVQERANSVCKEFIGSQEFIVNCYDRQITYIPKTRKDRITLLKKLIWAKLEDHWFSIPIKLANIEKRAFQELLDSLV